MKKFIVLLFCTLFLFSYIPVSAIDYGGLGGKPANPDPDNPRTKSIFIFNIEPGQEKNDAVLVVNNTGETKTVLVYATDSQRSSDGSFACEQFADPKDSVGSWITLEKTELTIGSGKNEKIDFKIKAPSNASVGEENGCIMIQEKKILDNDSSGVTLSFRTGLRVVATIPGEQIRKLDIDSFDAYFKIVERNQQDGSGTKVPLVLSNLTLKNEGNVSIDSKVHLMMDSLFGYRFFEIHNQYPVLRSDTATINFELPISKWGGIFNVYTNVEYDQSNQASVGIDSVNENTILNSERKIIFLMPELPYLIIELLVLIVLFTIIFFLIKRYIDLRKAQNTWIPYVVKSGDTINSIAETNSVSWKDIAKINKIKPPYTLENGVTILVPPDKE